MPYSSDIFVFISRESSLNNPPVSAKCISRCNDHSSRDGEHILFETISRYSSSVGHDV
jgi:hypothetical protein